jgi:DNA modification methylase
MAKAKAKTKRPRRVKHAENGEAANHDQPLVDGQTLWGGVVHGIPWEVHRGDAQAVLATLPDNRFASVVTSPPYYSQRDYLVAGQIGLEKTYKEYVKRLVSAFSEVKRVLSPDGTLFLNLGDTYYSGKGQPKGTDRKNGARRFGLRPVDASGLGVPRKTALGIPWRVALEMIDDGWTLRSAITWVRASSVPEPTAHDRPWRTYEMIFLFAKSPRYYFSRAALGKEEDIWHISKRPRNSRGVHSAAFPDELVEKCLSVGCLPKGEVLDPFAGSGTVLRVALNSKRPAFGIDLSHKFCDHMSRILTSTK